MPRGFKRSFRADRDGSVISPHTLIQLVVIFAAEFMGTAILLFLGCMGTMYPLGQDTGENRHLQAALIFGLVIMIIIQIIGHTSASHINPAVTLCALLLGKLRVVTFFVYVVAHVLGAILGVGVLKVITPRSAWNSTGADKGCCVTCLTLPHPALNTAQAFFIEFIISAILIYVVCSIWDKRNGIDPAAPIKFGLTICGLALAAGFFTGASMNPARSFAPALWEGHWDNHWIYWVAPLTGSIFATLTYTFAFERDYWSRKKSGDVPLSDIKEERRSSGDRGD